MLSLLAEVLANFGAEPRCTNSSRRAAELIKREKFDAVFLDWLMPEMSGLELAEQVRWSKSNSRCPIIMLTGNTKREALQECFRAGINFFLQKPVSISEIERLLNASRGMILQERRRYQRAPVVTEVNCAWDIESFHQKSRGLSVNVSPSGMLARLESTPPPGKLVSLKFKLPDDPQPFAFRASVVRLGPNQQVGLLFYRVAREQRERLANFVERVLSDTRTGAAPAR